MNPIERLQAYIRTSHAQAVTTLTPPDSADGVWFMDLACGDSRLTIEWSADTGFGVSSLSDDSYGERPDEPFLSLERVQRRINELLASNQQTTPPIGVMLSRLRELRGLTQNELALKLGIRQATVSGIERRGDIQFTTLCRVIAALGGRLEMFAVFADVRFRLSPTSIDPSSTARDQVAGAIDHSAIGRHDHESEGVFSALNKAGDLNRARDMAREISSRKSVLEMV